MLRASVLLSVVLLAGCPFNPSGLPAGDPDAAVVDGPPDAPDPDASSIDAPTDARVIDARTDAAIDAATDAAIDARVIDAAIDAPAPRCPTGYGPLGTSSSSYRVIASTATWAAAEADCNDDDDNGGFTSFTHLIVVGNDTEKAAITMPMTFNGNTWVGLTDVVTEGTFLWVTSEPTAGYPATNQHPPWDNGDPNGGAGENCVRFKNSFDFEDKPCTDTNAYVCECDDFAPR